MATIAQQLLEEGFQQGIELARQWKLDSIEFGIKTKFGDEGLTKISEIRKFDDLDVLHTILQALREVKTIDEFFEFIDLMKKQDYKNMVRPHFSEEDFLLSSREKQLVEKGVQKGFRYGILNAIELGLLLKFGVNSLRILPKIRKIVDNDLLHVIREAIKLFKTFDDFIKFVDQLEERYYSCAKSGVQNEQQ